MNEGRLLAALTFLISVAESDSAPSLSRRSMQSEEGGEEEEKEKRLQIHCLYQSHFLL